MKKFFSIVLISVLSIGFAVAQVDTIFQENFSSGLPAGWGNNGTSNGAANPWVKWGYTTVGCVDAYDNGVTMSSPTSANGYLLFDSDSLDNGAVAGNFGLGPAPAPQVVQLTTTAINVSGTPYCRLTFYQYFRNLESTTAVGFSTDSINWTMDTINTSVGLNDETPNSQKIDIDISPYINGQPKIYIRWFMNAYYYFWMLDDIMITTLPDNDLSVNYSYGVKGTSGMFYSSIPASQFTSADSFLAVTDYSNIGQVTQTTINTTFTEQKAGATLSTLLGSPAVAALAYGMDTLVAPAAQFGANGIGNYTVAVDVVAADSANFEPVNLDTISFAVTDTVFSINPDLIQEEFNGYYLLEQNEGNSFRAGNLFEITEADTVTSVTTALQGGTGSTAAGTVIQASIYPVTFTETGGNLTINYNVSSPQIQSFKRTLISGDLTQPTATNVTKIGLKMDNSSGSAILQPGIYWVGIGALTSPDSDVVICAMKNIQLGGLSAIEQNGTLYALNTSIPYCTMNLGHAATLLYASWNRNPTTTPIKTFHNVTFTGITNGDNNSQYYWSMIGLNSGYAYADTGKVVTQQFGAADSFQVCLTVVDNGFTADSCNWVKVVLNTGIDEVAPLSSVNLVPNPTTGKVTLSANGVNGMVAVSVMNMLGEVVATFEDTASGNYNGTYDLSSLSNGIYLIKISNDGSTVTKKLSISK